MEITPNSNENKDAPNPGRHTADYWCNYWFDCILIILYIMLVELPRIKEGEHTIKEGPIEEDI